jgi:hypothetical protein
MNFEYPVFNQVLVYVSITNPNLLKGIVFKWYLTLLREINSL